MEQLRALLHECRIFDGVRSSFVVVCGTTWRFVVCVNGLRRGLQSFQWVLLPLPVVWDVVCCGFKRVGEQERDGGKERGGKPPNTTALMFTHTNNIHI